MNLEQMGREDLEAQAELLGVKVRANASDDTLRRAIQEKLGEPVEEAQAVGHGEEEEQRVVINISKNDKDKQPVQVFLNGYSYVMKRGVDVAVPVGVVEILRHAEIMVLDPETNEMTAVPRFPFIIKG